MTGKILNSEQFQNYTLKPDEKAIETNWQTGRTADEISAILRSKAYDGTPLPETTYEIVSIHPDGEWYQDADGQWRLDFAMLRSAIMEDPPYKYMIFNTDTHWEIESTQFHDMEQAKSACESKFVELLETNKQRCKRLMKASQKYRRT